MIELKGTIKRKERRKATEQYPEKTLIHVSFSKEKCDTRLARVTEEEFNKIEPPMSVTCEMTMKKKGLEIKAIKGITVIEMFDE